MQSDGEREPEKNINRNGLLAHSTGIIQCFRFEFMFLDFIFYFYFYKGKFK